MTSEHRAACTAEIEEFVEFYINVDGAGLLSLGRLDAADLILLTAAINRWKETVGAVEPGPKH
jgi:hypothetical protein